MTFKKKNTLLSGRRCTAFAPCMVYVVLRNGFMLQVETQNHPRDELWVYPTWYVYNTWIYRYVCRYICIYVHIHIYMYIYILLLLLLLYFLCAASPRFPPSDLLQLAPLFDLSLLGAAVTQTKTLSLCMCINNMCACMVFSCILYIGYIYMITYDYTCLYYIWLHMMYYIYKTQLHMMSWPWP